MTQIYLTRRQVSQMYPISESTLARLASRGGGPVFYKPTDKALYRPQDVEQWIQAALVSVDRTIGDASTHAGRGRSESLRAPRPLPRVRDTISPKTGRQLKSLPPSQESWLRRNE